MGRWRSIAGFALSIALLAALIALLVTGDDGTEPTTSSARQNPRPQASPHPEPVPTPNTRGNDFRAIWAEINRFSNYLYSENPNPRFLQRIFSPNCHCYRSERAELQRFARNGWHTEGPSTQVLSVRLIKRPAPNVALLLVTDQQPPSVTVDRKGKVVRSNDGWEPTAWHFVLHRDKDALWRVFSIVKLGPMERVL